MKPLVFMGEVPEVFRCRVYEATDPDEEQRTAFLYSLATEGVVECPAYDGWLAALKERGWVDHVFVSAPGFGRYKRWSLSARGREEFAKILEAR
jgi:hypothetical protein